MGNDLQESDYITIHINSNLIVEKTIKNVFDFYSNKTINPLNNIFIEIFYRLKEFFIVLT